jgi:CubicO group peptidase (beta-lactamase class C family)
MYLKIAFLPLLCTLFLSFLQIERAAGQSISDSKENKKTNFPSDKRVQSLMAKYKVPAVGIGIIENGKIKHVKVFGHHQDNTPAPKNTIFNVASIAKPAAAMLVLRLTQNGQWNLDEPIAKYWTDPDVKDNPWHKKLTTRVALSHQTGFGNWRINNPTGKLTFDFEPGTKFGYSGEGYQYVRMGTALKIHVDWDKLMDSVLLKPFDLHDTQFYNDTTDLSRFAHWYDAQGKRYDVSYETGAGPADDLLTTVEDLCKLGIAVMNQKIVSGRLYEEMVTPQVKTGKNLGWGLGWQVVAGLPNGEYVIEHGGSDMGAKAGMIFLPKSKRGVVVLTNGDNGASIIRAIYKESLNIGKDILETMSPTTNLPKIVPVSTAVLRQYAGTYLQPRGSEMEVRLDGNVLTISGSGVPIIELFPYAKDKFFDVEYQIEVWFERDGNGKVVKGGIYEGGKLSLPLVRK